MTLVLGALLSFRILCGDCLNHQEITERAILNVTVQACRALAQAEGTDFSLPAEHFTAEGVAIACGAPKSSKTFRQAIRSIIQRNVRVEIYHAFNASFHFNDEMFVQGQNIIMAGIEAVNASSLQGNYEAARQKLGEICHALQVFYSHSNWVELGKELPNSNLLRLNVSIGNIAEESRATCCSCDGDDCTNNILEDSISKEVLTLGYFGLTHLSSTKPPG